MNVKAMTDAELRAMRDALLAKGWSNDLAAVREELKLRARDTELRGRAAYARYRADCRNSRSV